MMKMVSLEKHKFLGILITMTLIAVLLLPAYSCSQGSVSQDMDTIETCGGIVEKDDHKASAIIPAGVVTEEDFSVAKAKAPALTSGMAVIGDAYEYGPAGKTFEKPITVTLAYDEAKLPEGVAPSDLMLCIVEKDGSFTPLENIYVDTGAGTISGDTVHFSVMAVTCVENAGELKVYPEGFYFGDVLIHTSSTRTVTIANPTSSDIQITSIKVAPFAEDWVDPFASLSPAFAVAESNKSPFTIPAGGNHEIAVTFLPLLTGPYKACLLVSSEDATLKLPMQGQGVNSIGSLNIIPDFYDFGGVRLKPAPADTAKAGFTVVNNAALDVEINNLQVAALPFSAGNFALEGPSPAGTYLGKTGGAAPLQVAYTPGTGDLEFGYILAQGTDARGNPVGAVSILQGHGVAGVDIKVNALDFGKVLVGETKTLNTTIGNTGTLDFNQTQYKTTNRAFNPAFVPNPVAPLAAGQSAPAAINFTPEKRGPYVGAVVNASARIDKQWINSGAPLTGTGVDSYVSFSPNPVNFWLVYVGETAEEIVTMTNVGDFEVTVVKVGTMQNPFSISGTPTAGTKMAIGQSLSFTAKFAPSEEGDFYDSFEIEIEFEHDGMVYVDTYTVMASGVAMDLGGGGEEKVGISIGPAIDFGDVLVGTTEEKTATISNNSDEVESFFGRVKPIVRGALYGISKFGFSPVGDAQAGFGSFILSQDVTVTFNPTERRTYEGTLHASGTVGGNAVQATTSVTGRGVDAELTFNPNPCDFGEVCIGESKTIMVTVTNTGDFEVMIADYEFPTMGFEVISTVPRELFLDKGESYTYKIEFTPDEETTFWDIFDINVVFEFKGEVWESTFGLNLFGNGVKCEPKPWDVFISALDVTYTLQKPCSCPTWPLCGCGPGKYSFTVVLAVVGDDPEPMPGAIVTLHVTGAGTDQTVTVTTDSQGNAKTTISISTASSITFRAEVVNIEGEYQDRDMEYAPELNSATSVTKTVP